MPKLLFLINDAGFFLSHRLPIALEAKRRGYEVHVAAAPGPLSQQVVERDIIFHPLNLSRSGKNPLQELRSFLEILRLLSRLRPEITHLVTIKPVLYGGIAARLLRTSSIVAAISGLGTIFIGSDLKTRCIRKIVGILYRLSLNRQNVVTIFQNRDDLAIISRLAHLPQEATALIEGSGVNLDAHPVLKEPDDKIVVTMASRLLRDKGVREFVEAARLLQKKGLRAEFRLVGDLDPGNPTSITSDELAAWREEGIVEILGHRQDIPNLFSQSNIIVLPSYREGIPKVLLEAAASGRAIVTTDVPGCRDAIIPGKTGLLVPAKDSASLAAAIERLAQDDELRISFGSAARKLAEQKFSIERVVAQHINVYETLLTKASHST